MGALTEYPATSRPAKNDIFIPIDSAISKIVCVAN